MKRHILVTMIVAAEDETGDAEVFDLVKRLGAALARRHRQAVGEIEVCGGEEAKQAELN